jgi:hypothetical protein
MLRDCVARLVGRRDRGVSSSLPANGLAMTCRGPTGWRRPVQQPPGKMVLDGVGTVDVLPSEAAAEAVVGLEAEVTTEVEATVVEVAKVAADTITVVGEAVATTTDSPTKVTALY